MEDNGVEHISDVLITHYHHDHTEGLKDLRAHFGHDLRAWKLMPKFAGEHGPTFDLFAAGVRELSDGQTLSTDDGDATVHVMVTPGHTPDHVCFLLEEERAIFSGDCVLGGSSAVFEDLKDYMSSLHLLLSHFPPTNASSAASSSGATSREEAAACDEAARRIYPGHGPVIEDGFKTLSEYVLHRTARERQVVQALQGIPTSTLLSYTGLSSFGIVRAIYPQLSWSLRMAAAWNVEKHLEKLAADGVARRHDWLWWLPLPPIMGIRIDRVFFRRWFLRHSES